MLKNKYIFVLLFIAALLVYINSLGNPFIWDQEITIVGNPIIKSFDNLADVFKTDIFGNKISSISYYRPLAALSYMLDYNFWKLDPFGYHLTSILFHAFNAFLMFLLLAKTGIKRFPAFVVSLIFAVHPVNSESVDYLINDDLLGTLFSLLTFLFYLRFKEGKKIFGFFCGAAYILALLSKEWVVVVPFILIVYSFLFQSNNKPGRSMKQQFSFKPDATLIFLLLISAGYILVRIKSISGSLHGSLSLIASASLYERILTLPRIILTYLGLLIFPVKLHMEYHFVTKSFLDVYVMAGAPLLIISACFLIKHTATALRQNNTNAKLLIFYFAWFFIGLAPFYNIFVTLHSTLLEHWAYFPGIGFLACAALTAPKFYERIKSKPEKTFLAAALILLLCYYSAYTIKRNNEWGEPMRLYLHDLSLEPDSFVLHNNAGVVYFRNGRMEEAKKQFTDAINVSPGKKYDIAFNNLGVIYENENSLAKAISLYSESIRLNNYILAYPNLARACLKAGNLNEALRVSIEGKSRYPNDTDTNYYLAVSYFFAKQYASAKNIFEFIQNQLQPNYKDVPKYLEQLKQIKN